MASGKKIEPRYFWHNIGLRLGGWGGMLSPSQKNEWWQLLLQGGKVSAGYDNKPGHAKKLLTGYKPGDRIIAYASGHGALGWGIVEAPAYRTEAPFFPRSHRHFLEGIVWRDFAEKLEDGVPIGKIKDDFGIGQPLHTKSEIHKGQPAALILALTKKFANNSKGPSTTLAGPLDSSHQQRLLEEAYPRISPEMKKIIIPRHNKLSNQFCEWLKHTYGIDAIPEHNRIDIHFQHKNHEFLAELKVCCGDTTHAIREALGQLLEYNHYPRRSACHSWLIVLDTKPNPDDFTFIQTLRDKLSLPIWMGWQADAAFSFRPKWL